MTLHRRLLLSLALVSTTWGLAAPAHAQDKKELVIGATAGSNIEVLRLGIKPLLEKKGYKVKLVEFNDYVQPNLALAQGSLDANFFQHTIYLNRFRQDRQLDIVELVQGPMAPFGIYSKKRRSLAEVKPGDRITLANDPANLAHGLALLADQKLLTLKPGADPIRVTEKDIASNPYQLKLQPIEAAQIPRTLDDVEYAIVNGNFAISSGLKLTEALVLEKTPEHYLLVVAVKGKDREAAWTRDVAEAFHEAAFKTVLDQHFPGYSRPTFLQ
ncbi:D-methionine transport system substrate-binding protein [Roseateles sp. YR242]|uniref:MetQ/NlpA family ABC transporter substrate-binding protein n=1 Tax=Roseateles sp. YR242 TaxID=1855305 RepID=UPI0008D8C89D|nr:MetQ/NlpA family ABC transporter substrate-binding protein [Roseateles sp. YR242]SEK24340.1 D-methionine transport system substrate-binding protein [Roseateles sp. YR242]